MKTNKRPKSTALDEELIAVFKEMFGNDEVGLQEALYEAERALSIVKNELELHRVAYNGDYELF